MIAARVAQAVDPDSARRDAQHILSDGRFRTNPGPRPFRSQLEWFGDRLRGITNWISDVVDHVPTLLWLVIGIAIVAAILARVVVITRRRRVTGGGAGAGAGFGTDAAPEDPDALERAADEAERDGDLDRAGRLRFRAGLLRLGTRGTIEYRPSVTTGEVRRVLGSETFDGLARTFEKVAYGGQAAERPDVDAARTQWPRVYEETKRR